MKAKKFGKYLLSLMLLAAPHAHAVFACHWESDAAAREEDNQRNLLAADQGRKSGLTRQQAQNQPVFAAATADQVLKDKNSRNIDNLISRLQMAVQGIVSLGREFAADEKGRVALAALVNAVSSDEWIEEVKSQIDDIEASESLRESAKEVLNAFSEKSPDARVRVQDASLALQTALTAPDAGGAQTGLKIAQRTAVVRIKEASAISQTSRDELDAAKTSLARTTAEKEQIETSIRSIDERIKNEGLAIQRYASAKGRQYCVDLNPPPREAF